MIGFQPSAEGFVATLDDVEVALLVSLVDQVGELLGASATPAVEQEARRDPFALWADEFGPAVDLDHDDPLIRRLFPDAFADDPAASAEYRRLTEDAQRRARLADGELVLADLRATRAGELPLVVALGHLDPWIKTLNGVRLGLAVRLGIETEADHRRLERLPGRDPRAQLVSLYDWLGAVLESLLEAAGP